MQVYLLTSGTYDDYQVHGAFSYFRTLPKLLRKEQQEEQWYPLK
jgi:hypothetical protein